MAGGLDHIYIYIYIYTWRIIESSRDAEVWTFVYRGKWDKTWLKSVQTNRETKRYSTKKLDLNKDKVQYPKSNDVRPLPRYFIATYLRTPPQTNPHIETINQFITYYIHIIPDILYKYIIFQSSIMLQLTHYISIYIYIHIITYILYIYIYPLNIPNIYTISRLILMWIRFMESPPAFTQIPRHQRQCALRGPP